MATSRASSGLPYPERFYVAAAYAGFGGSPGDSTAVSRFQNDVALLLYGLYQQATVGPCTAPKPRAWNPVEQSKWTSWHGLGNMASTEAMRLFVKILEEEEPAWYSRVPQVPEEPSVDVEMFPKLESASQSTSEIGDSLPEIKTISSENGLPSDMEDKDVIKEGLDSVGIYDQWVAPPISGQHPKPRYAHGAAVLHDKMYIFGGNHNGRYLNDLQVLDLKTLSWSRIEAKELAGSLDSSNPASVAPSAGHSLIPWGDKILSIAGHTKDPSEAIIVKEFDPATCLWSNLKTYGKPPISRGGQSVTLVGNTLVIFGGEDAKRSLLNDLNILDLETMTWDDIDAIGAAPSPRSEHAAACHADRYLLIFGGGSHATCFNDLHVLDLQTMEWSKPEQQGVVPGPRAGHAGITIGENWFVAGGGNNKNGVSETLVLNMATLVWSVVTIVEGRVPLASEGLSLITSTHKGKDFLLSFGGYNGRYNNEVYVLKPSDISHSQSRMIDGPVSDTIAVMPSKIDASGDMEPEFEVTQNKGIKEIVVDNGDSEQMSISNKETIGHLVETLNAEKQELETTLDREQMHTVRLKQELAVAEMKNSELTKVRARAPGKIILSGEHAVVHGSAAIAAAIDLHTHVSFRLDPSLSPGNEESAVDLELKDMGLKFSWPSSKLREVLDDAMVDPSTPASCSLERIKSISALVEEHSIPEAKIWLSSGVSAFLHLYTSIHGYKRGKVVVTSDLPLGSGLGSSASFCVSLSGALLSLSDAVSIDKSQTGWFKLTKAELELVNKWAFEGEKIIHGKPSGIDNTISTFGNMIQFKSGELIQIKSSAPLRMLITNTKVGRNTKALVAGASGRSSRHLVAMSSVFTAVDCISKELLTILESPAADDISVTAREEKIEELMEMNQGLLQCMGVSHSSIETVLQTTLKYKLTSKLTGAGGGGCILTLLPTLLSCSIVNKVIAELESCGFQCLKAEVGGEGLEIFSG